MLNAWSFFIEVSMFDYKDTRWKRKQKQILKRDGYICQWCKRYGKKTEATTVHHIKHADEYPELVYTDSNLISLCSACHNKAHPEKANNKRRY
jgi:5-methylcytosine-specific restriction endonuclease McrA